MRLMKSGALTVALCLSAGNAVASSSNPFHSLWNFFKKPEIQVIAEAVQNLRDIVQAAVDEGLPNHTEVREFLGDIHTEVKVVKDAVKSVKRKDGVETLAEAAGTSRRLAGTAVNGAVLNAGNPDYIQILEREFNYITPENAGKWEALQPNSPTEWEFSHHDGLVDYSRDNGLSYKGHTLVWHSQAPAFINNSVTPAELREMIYQHITTTMERYAGQIHAWDVVNEAIADDGSFRNSVFYQKLGESYIADAFQLARSVDPQAQLIYNDYNIAGLNAKSDAVYEMLKGLVESGIPVDAIGFQMHLTGANAPGVDEMVANFRRFADLGLKINISELDVRVTELPWDSATRLAIQRQVYHRVASACLAFRACDAITTWGFTDAHSWIDSTYGEDDPLLYNEQYEKKPAWFGLMDGLMGIQPDALGVMPNLVANSHFEGGLEGWQNWGGALERELRTVYEGASALAVTGRTETWNGAAYPLTGLVAADQYYTASVQVLIDKARQTDRVELGARYRCAGGVDEYVSLATDHIRKKRWTSLEGELELPACDLEDVALFVSGPQAGVELYIDSVAVRPETLVPDTNGFGDNIIVNSSFEMDEFGWFGFGNAYVSVSSEQASSGQQSGYVTNRDDSWQGPATSLLLDADPGAEYQLLAWVRLESGTGSMNATLKTVCPSGDQYNTIASAAVADSAWTVLSGTFTVADCDLQELTLYFEGPAAGINFYIDDVYVREIPRQGPSDNLIPNASFENGVGGWTAWGGAAIEASTTYARTGTRSALLYNRSGNWQGPVFDLRPLVIAGETYEISAWGRIEGLSADVMNITVKTVCSDGLENYHQVDSILADNMSWSELSGSLTLPDCNLTEVSLYFDGPEAGVDVYLDDVVVTGATVSTNPNLVSNPDFENGVNGWVAWGGTLTATTDEVYSGAQSALLSGRTGNWQGPVYDLRPVVEPGATYDFSAWGRIGGASADIMNITVKTVCSDGTENYNQAASTGVNNFEWTELAGSLTLPDCNLTEVSLYFDGPAPTADIYLDDVSVTVAQ